MAVATRSTILGVKEESAEGTLAAPAAATDFVAIQDDLAWSKNVVRAENAELTGSIGRAKGIITGEEPGGSFSHYLRASGTAGTAPNYAPFLKSFFGSQAANSTERTTAASSTVSLLKVAANATDFARGTAVFVQDDVNGRKVRPVDSNASGTDINLGFNLAAAPASGVALGKCVYWSPASDSHPTLTLWQYVGSDKLKRVMAGCRVTELSFEMVAQELINMNIGFEGVKSYENPIEITSSTEVIDFEDDGGAASASVAVKWYQDPYELAEALETAMNAAGSETWTVSFSKSTGKFTFSATGTTVEIHWNTGANTASSIASKVGFSTAADSTGATTYTSATAQSYAASYTPTYDSNTDPVAAKGCTFLLGAATDTTEYAADSVKVTATNTKRNLKDINQESGLSGSVINGRTIEMEVKAYVAQHDVEMFKNLRKGQEIKFFASAGPKSGSNPVAGKINYCYSPTCNVADVTIDFEDDVAMLTLKLEAHVTAGAGEFYMGTL